MFSQQGQDMYWSSVYPYAPDVIVFQVPGTLYRSSSWCIDS